MFKKVLIADDLVSINEGVSHTLSGLNIYMEQNRSHIVMRRIYKSRRQTEIIYLMTY